VPSPRSHRRSGGAICARIGMVNVVPVDPRDQVEEVDAPRYRGYLGAVSGPLRQG